MRIETELINGVLVVRLDGEFDMVLAGDFRNIVDEYLENGSVNLLVNLHKVTFMDSSGLGAVLGRYKKITQQGGQMGLTGVRPNVETMLKLSGIMKIVPFFADESTALRKLA